MLLLEREFKTKQCLLTLWAGESPNCPLPASNLVCTCSSDAAEQLPLHLTARLHKDHGSRCQTHGGNADGQDPSRTRGVPTSSAF